MELIADPHQTLPVHRHITGQIKSLHNLINVVVQSSTLLAHFSYFAAPFLQFHTTCHTINE